MASAESREEFAEFYSAAWGGTVAHVYAITADMGAAQEVAQEAMLRAWQRWDSIRQYDEPMAWLIRVAHNLALSRWRRARTAARGLTRMGKPQSTPEASAESVAVVAALKQLPEAQRRALVLHHMAGWPVAQVADAEGVPEGTIKARLSRGRAALAPLLSDVLPRDDDKRPPAGGAHTAEPPPDDDLRSVNAWLRALAMSVTGGWQVCDG